MIRVLARRNARRLHAFHADRLAHLRGELEWTTYEPTRQSIIEQVADAEALVGRLFLDGWGKPA